MNQNMEVLVVGEDFNNFNDMLNSSGNKRQISTAIQKVKTENRRNLIKSAHPKNNIGYMNPSS